MSLTGDLKDELAGYKCETVSQWQCEISAMLRFAGGLHLVSGRIVIEAELDSSRAAARLRHALQGLYKISSSIVVVKGSGIRKGQRYVVRVVQNADKLARLTGLIDQLGRPIRGLPSQIISGGKEESIAVLRGAFLARGSLTDPGRSASLEISCPGPESALAIMGAVRRFGATAKMRDVRGVDKVIIREGDMISNIIEAMGAPNTYEVWKDGRNQREMRGAINRLANFDDANLRRSVRAAVVASTRVKKAFEILGDDVPDHLKEAGMLRLEHKHASLEELGRYANPPLTKDAVAGRIRRLLGLADKRAHELGIPDTESALNNTVTD